jgi:dTDP-4-amino-4,6-dideoxygalactose transaminase
VLGCFGDGGAVVSADPDLAHKVRLLRDHGRGEDGIVAGWGLNSRLDNIQAAVLDLKLRSLPADIERRREVARRYDRALRPIDELVLPPGPDEDDIRFDVYQNYEIESDQRDELRRHLHDDGIGTIVQWAGQAVHQLPALGLAADLPATDRLFERCLLLPMNTSLTDDEVARICGSVRSFYGLDHDRPV